MVAYNEEGHIGPALRALLALELPAGYRWGTVWVVASGCTDRTEEIVRDLAERDPRVVLLTEPERRGKARALKQVFERAVGEYLLLVNSDAYAAEDALSKLLEASAGAPVPSAVMGRPTVPRRPNRTPFDGAVELLWDLHDALHQELLAHGEGTHLSDELLLLHGQPFPTMPPEVINDGSFLGAWLTLRRGTLSYAPEARVTIEVPAKFRDHLLQRERILVGHEQVLRSLAVAPSTFPSYFRRDPKGALRLLVGLVRNRRHGVRSLAILATAELGAVAMARWASIPPHRDFTIWERIRVPSMSPRSSEP